MRDVFVRKLSELASKDPRIMLLTGDLGFGVLDEFSKKFPKQYLNVGVAEQNMTGIATGLALDGKIVFTYSIANFSTLRCLEQIRNDAAYHHANVKVVSIGGGFSYGALGMSHHATEDLSIMRSIPELTVVAPGDDWEAEQATEALVRTPGTAYFRLDKMSSKGSGQAFSLGTPSVLQKGKELAILCVGGVMRNVLSAVKTLQTKRQSFSPSILSCHTIKPFNASFLNELLKTHSKLLIVEEHMPEGGLYSVVTEALFQIRPAQMPIILRAGLSEGFCSMVGSQDYLQAKYRLDEVGIAGALEELLGYADSNR